MIEKTHMGMYFSWQQGIQLAFKEAVHINLVNM